MSGADAAAACAVSLTDALVRAGVASACVAPGSRSTPVTLAFARDPRIQTIVHLDERSAAFFALGRAKATGRPVAVVCTSGSATANFFPAIVEASMSRVPLLIVTADRPPELHGVGANQTIDQRGLYGGYVRWFHEPDVPGLGDRDAWRAMGERAVAAANGPPAGPVHLNLAFREPLVPATAVQAAAEPLGATARAPVVEPSGEDLDAVAPLLASDRGVIVAGGGDLAGLASLAARMGWPLIAEPHSGARTPGALTAAQPLLLAGFSPQPDVVVHAGMAPTSRATQTFVDSARALITVDPDGWTYDPSRRATRTVRADARALLARAPERDKTSWPQEWREADRIARAAFDHALDAIEDPFEPRVARDVAATIEAGARLCVASSMPIRDLDLAMAPRDGIQVLSSRGASGIDGFASTVLGAGPAVALCGDLSFLHDVGGFLWGARRGEPVTFVVLDNGGGGIFDLLPQASLPEHERLFVTPHGLDVGAIARAAGAAYRRIDGTELVPALRDGHESGARVLHVAIDRARALDGRRAVIDAVRRALA